ncbi:uncharacterized protein LOC117791816 [Drosophila innubila]|uniref:uncharacterized protein LOC117791816 n=1 Tax=Drosophila innubila TaxID=198719 RepID=UPI00148E2D80|nr:uncharacterized protein LOC117791816 [Drosophila innubila]
MRVVFYMYLIVLSALLSMLAMATAFGIRSRPRTEMSQLTMADLNQEQKQEPENPAVRFARQLGFARHFDLGRFGSGAGILGGLLGGGLSGGLGGALHGRFEERRGGEEGIGGVLGGIRRFLGRPNLVRPDFLQQSLRFFG